MSVTLDMIGIVTKDTAESLRFYRTLGLDIPELDESEDYVSVTLPNGLRISWNTVELIRQIEPDYVEPVGTRLGLAFLCTSPADVDAKHGALIDAGFKSKKEPWDAFWGQRYAMVEDPDGNSIDLFAPLP